MAVVSGKVTDLPANVWVIAPPDDAVLATRLTNSRELLEETASGARVDTLAALERGPVARARA